MTQAALWLKFLDQFFERDVLMRVSTEARFFYPGRQLTERRVTRQIATQRQCVNEKSDQRLDLCKIPVRNRRPDYQVVLPRITCEQRLERRQQAHE